MAFEQLNGFVLHRRSYRETSYLTDLFTFELGKVSAVAKGVRGKKSDKRSLLQAFQPLQFGLSGKHELRNLNQIDASDKVVSLVGNQLFCAMYLNELLNRVLPKEVPHPELFALYQHSLHWLAENKAIEPCLRQFELHLLDELGYGFDLAHDCESGEPIEPQSYYSLVLENGLKRIDTHVIGSNQFSGEVLLQVSRQQWQPDSLQCAKRLTRMALLPLLGSKPLKSRELFQQTWMASDSTINRNNK